MAPTLWVFLGLLPVYVSMAAGFEPFGYLDLLAFAVTFGAIWIEARSDKQLKRFRDAGPAPEEFLHSGLWAWSRHPNYFGEIVLWVGVAVIAVPVLRGWQWVTLISPVFVTLLLARISGVPMLEKRADEKWGGQEDYEAYKDHTPVLIPRPPRRSPE
jgi:steroid 5-alpha reductase family enzyme